MANELHQMQMSYHAEEDRLLLKASTRERAEFRIWLTRAYTLLLWEKLNEFLKLDPDVSALSTEEEKSAVLAYKKHEALKNVDFTTVYSEQIDNYPLGTEGVLAYSLSAAISADGAHIEIKPRDGLGLNFTMDRGMNNAFCKMLYEAVNRADWDLGFEYEDSSTGSGVEAAVAESESIDRMKMN